MNNFDNYTRVIHTKNKIDVCENHTPHAAVIKSENNSQITDIKDETNVFENYTPHTIIVKIDDQEFTFPSCGIARVTEEQAIRSKVGNIELRETKYKEITGLPEPATNKMYIVSIVVAQANLRLTNPRSDLVCPDTGLSCIRGQNGQILAVTGFVLY